MSTAEPPFRWSSVAIAVFLPSTVFAVGEFAMIPVLPALAAGLGVDVGGAALIASMLVVGVLIGDIPSGAIIARIGERTAMTSAAGLALVGAVIAIVAPNAIVLGVAVLLIGIAAAAFGLARHAFMTSFVPLSHRARALSTLGGSHRLGAVVGPFIGAGLLVLTGDPYSVLWMLVVCCLISAGTLLVFRDPAIDLPAPTAGATEVAAEALGLWRTLLASRKVLLSIGIGSAILSGMRQTRQVVLPVWATSIGLDATTTSIIVGVAGVVDFSLFFLGGWLMDKRGRMWAILPCSLGLSLGMLALAFTHDLDARVAWYLGLSLVIGVANGLGSGILMTLGADLADRRNPAPFLGAWRFTNDSGGAALPIIVTAITAATTLSIAVGALGVIGLIGTTVLAVMVPRFVSTRPGGR